MQNKLYDRSGGMMAASGTIADDPLANCIRVVIARNWAISRKALLLASLGALVNISFAATLRAAPCGKPIPYTLGTIDRRFGMTGQEALAAMRDAVAIWNSAAGTDIIEYGGGTGLPVNFIYDDRERMFQDHAAYVATIKQAATEIKQIDKDTVTARQQLTAARASFRSEESAFKAKQKMYNHDVERLNNGGGGTDEQVKAFDENKRQLDQQLGQLKDEQAAINDLVERENTLISRHNALANRANTAINIINQDVGKDFVAGLYTLNNSRAQSDIFAFADRADLVGLLAHEFGHALGLGHSENPNSVMAALRETGVVSLDTASESKKPSSEDISLLRGVCR